MVYESDVVLFCPFSPEKHLFGFYGIVINLVRPGVNGYRQLNIMFI